MPDHDSDSDDDSGDASFDLLAPQRKMKGLRISTKISNKTKRSTVPKYDVATKCVDQAEAPVSSVSDRPLEGNVDTRSKASLPHLHDLILDNKCILYNLLSPRALINLVMTSTTLWRYFCELHFRLCLGFGDLARVLRAEKGFGVLSGCSLVVGTDDENILIDDLAAVTSMLQKPKTQLDVTFIKVNAHISREVEESAVLEFVRSFRFPPLLTLTSVSLEGSVIGPKGFSHLCSVLRQKCLPNLSKLNLSRNAALSTGIDSLNKTLCDAECCPLLHTLCVASNRAELCVVDLLCGQLLIARPKLKSLDISDNSTCLMDGNAIVTMKSNKPRLNSLSMLDLSFNPLQDAGMHALLSCSWPMRPQRPCQTDLQHLLLVNCNIGNKTFALLGDLLKAKTFPQLETLSLGMNDGLGRTGIVSILEAMSPLQKSAGDEDVTTMESCASAQIRATSLPSLKHLLFPLNNLKDEGMLAVMSAALLGAFRWLQTLDISDIGASTDTISKFIVAFTQHAPCDHLQKLVIFGRHPFAQRTMRHSNIPRSFSSRVKMS